MTYFEEFLRWYHAFLASGSNQHDAMVSARTVMAEIQWENALYNFED